jgi:hypothetical protein
MTRLDISWADASRTLLVIRRDGAVFNVPADPDNSDFTAIAAAIDLSALPAPPPVAASPMPGALAMPLGPGTAPHPDASPAEPPPST